ncbi:MAG: type II toxin-antitoxin system RelE/ParE family toxin [Rhabdochlamydiaceae bacterium]
MIYELHKTPEFEEWLDEQPLKSRLQVEERLLHIACEGHFGTCKHLTDHVWELKWANGRRVYYAYLAEYNILLLLGGNKNGQNKDINQAQKILRKYAETSP